MGARNKHIGCDVSDDHGSLHQFKVLIVINIQLCPPISVRVCVRVCMHGLVCPSICLSVHLSSLCVCVPCTNRMLIDGSFCHVPYMQTFIYRCYVV